MPVLTLAQTKQYAQSAGFSGQSLNIILAIAQAESSLNTDAKNINLDGSVDRGILQINNRYHPEVQDNCAYSPVCAFSAGYKISGAGSDFTAWSSYTSGAYLAYLDSGASAGADGQLRWLDYPVSHGYEISYKGPGTDTPHYALDFATPQDTPFFFLEPGTIKKADYQPWGGEVYLQPDDKSKPQEYVLHLDEIDTQVGQHIDAGQQIGLTGGQVSGGKHPTSAQYSTGPHVHFGEFSEYRSTQNGTIPYGPDPTDLVNNAKNNNTNIKGNGGVTTLSDTKTQTTPTPLSNQINQLLSEFPGFSGIAIALDKAESFPGVIWYNPGATISVVPSGSVGDVINGFASAVLDPQDYIGAALRSVLDTIISNTIPLAFRALIVFIGLMLVIGLINNVVAASGIQQDFSKIAAVAL